MFLQNAVLHGLQADFLQNQKRFTMLKIKRPLAVIGFTFFITGTTVLSMPKEYIIVLLALFALFVFIHSRTRKIYTKHMLLMLITAISAVVYVNIYTDFYQRAVDSIPTDTQVYKGYVKEITNQENTGYIVALLDENKREIYNVSIYYANGFNIGDTVEITGKFRPAKRDKYIFANYSENIKGSIVADKIVHSDTKINTVKYIALSIKRTLIKSASELYSHEYLATVNAIAYNDKHMLSNQTVSLFKAAGMSHALVVSGLHIGIIVMAVQSLLRYLPFHKKYKNIITAALAVVFMYIVGLSPSVVRAGFLAVAVLMTRNIHKEQDSFTTLALIGLVSIIINPYITRNTGAMLSYAACIGIIIANRWCRLHKLEENKRNIVCAVAAVVFTAPVLAFAGMYVTLMSPLYNAALAVFVTAICVLSVLTPVFNLIPVIREINPFLVTTNKFLMDSLLNMLMFIYQYLDFTTILLHSPLWKNVIIAVLIAVFIAYVQFENKKYRKFFVIAVSIFTFVCYNLMNYNIVTITAFDSGREGSFHIQSKNGEYLVLTEELTVTEAENLIVSSVGNKYKTVYYCPKEFKTDIDMSIIAEKTVEIVGTAVYCEEDFILSCDINGSKKLFTITVADCDISFGHGKVTSVGSEYYFLGNDKPKEISAGEIYIFGNTPSWMEVDNIYNINSDIKIRINCKNGKYKTVKDVLNFGYRL